MNKHKQIGIRKAAKDAAVETDCVVPLPREISSVGVQLWKIGKQKP